MLMKLTRLQSWSNGQTETTPWTKYYNPEINKYERIQLRTVVVIFMYKTGRTVYL